MAGATALSIDSFSYDGDGSFTISIDALNYPNGIFNIEVFASVGGIEQDLGPAVPQGGSDYEFVDKVGASRQDAISLTLTDPQGNSRSTYGYDSLQTGIRGQQYVAEHDIYDIFGYNGHPGSLTRADYYEPDGSVVYSSTGAYNSDQTVSYTYANGTFFDDKCYSSFADTYSSSGVLISDARTFDSGKSLVVVETPGQTVASRSSSLFNATDISDTTFVFTPGYARDIVLGFQTAGRNHDTLDLPSSDFTSIADVLRHTQDVGNGTTIFDPISGDRLHLAEVTKNDLVQHRRDLALHA